jgi:hypothetical protein
MDTQSWDGDASRLGCVREKGEEGVWIEDGRDRIELYHVHLWYYGEFCANGSYTNLDMFLSVG